MRDDGRSVTDMRPVKMTPGYIKHAEGSVLIEVGDTRLVCTASVEHRVPPWLRDQKCGWVTAEYGMLPRSTSDRSTREATRGKMGGRTLEIQRLIGRSLRAVVDRVPPTTSKARRRAPGLQAYTTPPQTAAPPNRCHRSAGARCAVLTCFCPPHATGASCPGARHDAPQHCALSE